MLDYRIHSSSQDTTVAGGSAFNINAKSLRLGDFNRAEVAALLGQHTEETGQRFDAEALELVWRETRGQPWLANALCNQASNEADQGRAITADEILAAREDLILQRVAHLAQLADKLREERVRRVVEPVLNGASEDGFSDRDLEYVRDLGLAARNGPIRIANPIYREVVPRELTWGVQQRLREETVWYVRKDGTLDLSKLMAAFQRYYRENSEFWIGRFAYRECGPQLLVQAFLQRIVNGGGRINREYALGRGRTDLLVTWPAGVDTQRFAIECKVRAGGLERVLGIGLEQLSGYMDRCGADAGHLVIFNREEAQWHDKVFRRATGVNGRPVEVCGMCAIRFLLCSSASGNLRWAPQSATVPRTYYCITPCGPGTPLGLEGLSNARIVTPVAASTHDAQARLLPASRMAKAKYSSRRTARQISPRRAGDGPVFPKMRTVDGKSL